MLLRQKFQDLQLAFTPSDKEADKSSDFCLSGVTTLASLRRTVHWFLTFAELRLCQACPAVRAPTLSPNPIAATAKNSSIAQCQDGRREGLRRGQAKFSRNCARQFRKTREVHSLFPQTGSESLSLLLALGNSSQATARNEKEFKKRKSGMLRLLRTLDFVRKCDVGRGLLQNTRYARRSSEILNKANEHTLSRHRTKYVTDSIPSPSIK